MGRRHDSPFDLPPEETLRFVPGTRLEDLPTRATPGYRGDKRRARDDLAAYGDELSDLQELLFADGRTGGTRSVLLVLQGMDTSGKGGVLRKVVGLVDPQGVDISSFGPPTEEEAAQDFLRRVEQRLPVPGRIGVFDRSHYEDVLVQRVEGLAPPEEIERRYAAIVDFEQRIAESGTTLLKVMLHLGKDEQKERLTERLDRPEKHWKFSPGDLDARARWDDYREAYRIALERTATDEAPWFVVPCDRKWYARLAVAHLLRNALRSLDLTWPRADFDVAAQKARLAAS
jgi:PPK2 family polyphosphate:nucleotide phosphotransferase